MSVWKIGAGVTESGAKVTPFSSVSERYSARSLHSLSYCFASPLIREYVALTESGILEKSAPPFSPSDTLHRTAFCGQHRERSRCRNGKSAQNIVRIFEFQTLRPGGVSARNHVK